MATRTIPDNPRPWWSCTVNGKEYTYRSGETVDVPDAVADIIDNINQANERPAAKADPVLPKITAADEGKVVKVVGGVYVLAEEEGGGTGAAALVMHAMGELLDAGSFSVNNVDKTPAEVIEAVDAARPVLLEFTITTGEDEYSTFFAPLVNITDELFMFIGPVATNDGQVQVVDLTLINSDGVWSASTGKIITIG